MIKKLVSHNLFRNTFRIFTSNIIIQLISFLFLPVFSRVYTPEDYGVWGFFIFLSGFIAVFAGLRYELAIMIPDSNRMAHLLFRMTHSLMFLTTILALVVILCFYKSFIDFFQLPDDFLLWLLIPFQAWLTAIGNLLTQWYSRRGDFKLLSRMRIYQSVTNILVSLFLGFFLNLKYYGLIFGLISSLIVSNSYLAFKLELPVFRIRLYKFKFYKKWMIRYKNFLYYSTPLGILNYFSTNILVSVIQVNYGSRVMGYYSNANRLVQSPLGLVSSAVGMVFYPHFSKSVRKLRDVTLVFAFVLVIFSLILAPLVIWGEEILGFYLGKNWVESAVFIRLLSFYFIFSTSVSCISPIFSYLQKENFVLIWQIVYLSCSIWIFKIFSGDLKSGVYYYSLMGGLAYLFLFCLGVYLLKKKV